MTSAKITGVLKRSFIVFFYFLLKIFVLIYSLKPAKWTETKRKAEKSFNLSSGETSFVNSAGE